MKELERIDVLLSKSKNISRGKAKELILSEKVFVDGKKITKVAFKVLLDSQIETTAEMKYVGRGGYKLEKALDYFSIDVNNKICMDVGASTGGFSDCLLQNNAHKIYAIDVGHSQLAEKIAIDSRVVSLEKTNIKNIQPDSLEPMDFVCVDVSFISLTKILENTHLLMKEEADIVCLLKPQFEAGKENLNKSGIVKKPKVHVQVLQNVIQYASDIGFRVEDATFSGIKGAEGNIEYLLHMKRIEKNRLADGNEIIQKSNKFDSTYVKNLVQDAFEKL